MKRLIAAMMLVLTSQVAMADFLNGKRLNGWIDSDIRVSIGTASVEDHQSSEQLLGYLSAIADGGRQMGLLCIPNDVSAAQIISIVGNYVKANPAKWNDPGSTLAFSALIIAFPFPKQPQAKPKPQS